MNLNDITPSTPLALSDGTPVTFVKITSKDNIQVRVPDSHAELGDDPLRIFRRDGTHFKDATDLELTVADGVRDITPTGTEYLVNGATFVSLADAQQEAKDLFFDGEPLVEIYAIQRKLVSKVGFLDLAA